MTVSAHLKAARELVRKAEAAYYQDGDDAACARLLSEALMSGFRELAGQMGHPFNTDEEAKQFARSLDEVGNYDGILVFATSMLEHSQGADWTEDPEFAWQFDEFPLAIAVTGDGLDLLQNRILGA